MKTLWAINQGLLATIGGILGYLLGGLDGALYALVSIVAIDYVTGVLKAWHTKTLSSTTGFIGIARKVLIFALVALANILDVHVLGKAGVLRTATIFFYISNEGISILENCTVLGLPIPEPLRAALAAITKNTELYQPRHSTTGRAVLIDAPGDHSPAPPGDHPHHSEFPLPPTTTGGVSFTPTIEKDNEL